MESLKYVRIFLRSHNEQKIYKREGYDILTYLADLGGITDLLHTVFGRMSGFFAGKLLTAALISAAYRV